MINQLEKLFEELTAILYGLPLLVWRVVFSPVRGSLRFYVKHRHGKEAVIGPRSALLLVLFVLSLWLTTERQEFLRETAATVFRGRSFQTWQPMAVSLMIAAGIEASYRLYALVRFPRHRRRRDRAVVMFLYASSCALAITILLFSLISAVEKRFDWRGPWLVWLYFIALFVAGTPIAAVAKANRAKTGTWRGFAQAMPLLFFLAFLFVSEFSSRLVRWVSEPAVKISIPYVTCVIERDSIYVTAILRNRADTDTFVRLDGVLVRIYGQKAGLLGGLPLTVRNTSGLKVGDLLLVRAGESVMVDAWVTPESKKYIAETRGDRCDLVKPSYEGRLWLEDWTGGYEGNRKVTDRRPKANSDNP